MVVLNTATNVCPCLLLPPVLSKDRTVFAAQSFVLVGVWTVFCSVAIRVVFIAKRVSLKRKKKIPEVLLAWGGDGGGA